MNSALANYTIAQLRAMPVPAADRMLCNLHNEALHAIAEALGARLPTFGGDKPARILALLNAA